MKPAKIIIDDEFKAKAAWALGYTREHLLSVIWGMKLIKDNEYYLAYGFETMEAFVQSELSLARSAMYNYLDIGKSFLPYLIDDEGELKVHHGGLSTLGVKKLLILASLDPEQRRQLAETGAVTIDKRTYTIAEIKAMNREELAELVGNEKKTKPGEQLSLFDHIYSYTEKTFNKIILATRDCEELIPDDRKFIEDKLREIAAILETYKMKKV